MKYTRQLFVHKIGGFTQWQTTPFLIYAFVSLQTVAYYGNYTIIVEKINTFISNFLGSTGAGVGNLIAEGNKSKEYRVFWELVVIRFFVSGIIMFSIYMLIEPFISLWLGAEYILPRAVLIIILINFFLNLTRGATDQFLYGHGLFYDTWSPVVEAAIYITVAIIGGHFLGLEGVLLGSTVSLSLVIGCWKPYFLFTKGFKISIIKYWIGWWKYVFLILLSGILSYYFLSLIPIRPDEHWGTWIVYAIITTTIITLVETTLLLLFTQGMRDFVRRIIKK